MVEDQRATLLSSHTLEGEMKGSSGSFGVGEGGGCRADRAFAVQSFLTVSSLSARGHGRVLGR